jgi:SAM-dependent methyltransferase
MLSIDFERFGLKDGERLLDVGCGVGRHVLTGYRLKNIEAVGIDLGLDDLKTTAERFRQDFKEAQNPTKTLLLAVGDATNLPFSDRCFDKLICSEVLEHIPDYRSALQEIRRVLKPGGILAISVPRFWTEWICWRLSSAYHHEKGGHIRIFNAAKLRRDIETQGLTFLGRHWAHSLHVPYWWLQCLFWSKRERSAIIKAYHRFLVWDLMKKPLATRLLDQLLNPVLGKSIVMYFRKD